MALIGNFRPQCSNYRLLAKSSLTALLPITQSLPVPSRSLKLRLPPIPSSRKTLWLLPGCSNPSMQKPLNQKELLRKASRQKPPKIDVHCAPSHNSKHNGAHIQIAKKCTKNLLFAKKCTKRSKGNTSAKIEFCRGSIRPCYKSRGAPVS